jgi:hypothetical protein
MPDLEEEARLELAVKSARARLERATERQALLQATRARRALRASALQNPMQPDDNTGPELEVLQQALVAASDALSAVRLRISDRDNALRKKFGLV